APASLSPASSGRSTAGSCRRPAMDDRREDRPLSVPPRRALRKSGADGRQWSGAVMTSGVEQRFQTLHEIVKAARVNLNDNFWDYLIGGAETETTARRHRQAPDSVAFRHRVLRTP